MTQQEIQKAFEGRWRIKGKLFFGDESKQEEVKDLCRDFFTAGILIAENAQQAPPALSSVDPADSRETTINVYGYETHFDAWWSLYDKKCGKEKCLQKWNKLTKQEQADCIRATPAYVASTPDKQFRKHPLTYLNQKAWNDEIIPHNNGNTNHSLQEQRSRKLASILTE